MDKPKILKFTCPKCSCNELEEVLKNVTVLALISVADDGSYEYKDTYPILESGNIIGFQCHNCGYMLSKPRKNYNCGYILPKPERSNKVIDNKDLVNWLKNNVS